MTDKEEIDKAADIICDGFARSDRFDDIARSVLRPHLATIKRLEAEIEELKTEMNRLDDILIQDPRAVAIHFDRISNEKAKLEAESAASMREIALARERADKAEAEVAIQDAALSEMGETNAKLSSVIAALRSRRLLGGMKTMGEDVLKRLKSEVRRFPISSDSDIARLAITEIETLRAERDAARNKALEEAATFADLYSSPTARLIADRIRAAQGATLMDKSELRGKVIEAMESAFWGKWREDNEHGSSATNHDCMIAALDALHGIACVVPPMATDEMLKAATDFRSNRGVYLAMVTTADITQPKDKPT